MALVAGLTVSALTACGSGDSEADGNEPPPPPVDLSPTPMLTLTVQTASTTGGNVRLSVAGDEVSTSANSEQIAVTVAPGTTVSVTAVPTAGRSFIYWSGDSCADAEASRCAFEVRRDNLLVTAHFAVVNRLSVSAQGPAAVRAEVDVDVYLLGDNPNRSMLALNDRSNDRSMEIEIEVPVGARVVLTPRAEPGGEFFGWRGETCELFPGACEFSFTRETDVSAMFDEVHTLSLRLSAQGTATGTVSVTGAPLGPVPARYAAGATLTVRRGSVLSVTASPARGSALAPWDACRPATNPCTLTMDQDRSVEARFVGARALSLNIVGNVPSSLGAVTVSGDFPNSPRRLETALGALAVAAGTVLTLQATPLAGSAFAGWQRSAQGCVGFALSCQLTLTDHVDLQARFAAVRRLRLVASARESGAGELTASGHFAASPHTVPSGSDATLSVPVGTEMRLQANALGRSVFFDWGSAADDPCADQPSECRFVASDHATITATFSGTDRVELSWDNPAPANGVGAVVVDGDFAGAPLRLSAESASARIVAPKNIGLSVALRADASAGSVFIGWADDSSVCPDATTNPCSMPVNADATWAIRSRFQRWRLLTVGVSGHHGGHGTLEVIGVGFPAVTETLRLEAGDQQALGQWRVVDGAAVTLQATPAAGSGFAHWNVVSDPGIGVMPVPALSVVVRDANSEAAAEFAALRDVTLTMAVDSNVPDSQGQSLGMSLWRRFGVDDAFAQIASLPDNGAFTLTRQVLSVYSLRLDAMNAGSSGDVPLRWEGGACSGTGEVQCVIPPAAEALHVTGTYSFLYAEPEEFTLTASAQGGSGTVFYEYSFVPVGRLALHQFEDSLSISPGMSDSVIFLEGNPDLFISRTGLILTVVPAPGYSFVRWGADATGELATCHNMGGACRIMGLLTRNAAITAVFEARRSATSVSTGAAGAAGAAGPRSEPWTLDIFGPGQVFVQGRPLQGGRRHALRMPAGETLRLRAEPDAGMVAAARGADGADAWEGWGAACSDAGSRRLCVLSLGAQAKAAWPQRRVSAHFAPFFALPERLVFGLRYDSSGDRLALLSAGALGALAPVATATLGAGAALVLPLAAHWDDWPVVYAMERCASPGDCAALLGGQRALSRADVRAAIRRFAPPDALWSGWGQPLALSGDGATLALSGRPQPGAEATGLRLYRRDATGWPAQRWATPPPAAPGAVSALALDATGATLAVGHAATEGAVVRLYRRVASRWHWMADVRGDVAGADGFAEALSLSADGDVLAVGASARSPGTVHVFRRATDGSAWTAWTRLAPTGPVGADARFGAALALSTAAGHVLVGAPGAGEAQLWRLADAPTLERRFAGEADAGFGRSVAIARAADGAAVIAIGAPDAGALHLYRARLGAAPTWRHWRLAPTGAGFGAAVSLSADAAMLAVGDPQGRCALGDAASGAVRMFAALVDAGRPAWRARRCLPAASAMPGARFGAALALSSDGQRLLVGAPSDDGGAYLH